MKLKKPKFETIQWILTAIYVVLAILLIIWPEQSLNIIFIVLGSGLCVWGIIKIIQYFKEAVEVSIISHSLTLGFGLVIVGILVIIFSEKISDFMSIVFACMLFIGALSKIQTSFDLKKLKIEQWYLPLFATLITLILALLIIFNPFNGVKVLTIFIGVSLLIEAILNVITNLYMGKKSKHIHDEKPDDCKPSGDIS